MAQNTTLSAEIAEKLRAEILRQRYRADDRLPSERELAVRYAASRGAVREALSQLEQLGLISVQPGGARVQAIQSARIAILGPLMSLNAEPDANLVDQFLQTFGALASLTARETIAIADTTQLKQLQNRLETLRKLCGDLEAFQPKWVEFLEGLAEISDNLVVRLIGNDLKAQFVGQVFNLNLKPTLKKNSLLEILQLLEQALQHKDKDQAHRAVTRYFDELRVAMQLVLSKRMAS